MQRKEMKVQENSDAKYIVFFLGGDSENRELFK